MSNEVERERVKEQTRGTRRRPRETGRNLMPLVAGAWLLLSALRAAVVSAREGVVTDAITNAVFFLMLILLFFVLLL